MTERPVVLIGGGGHALVVAEAIGEDAGLIGFFDDNPAAPVAIRFGLPCLGPLGDLPDPLDAWFILALGNLVLRRAILPKLANAQSVGITHHTAWVSPTASLGKGVFIAPHAAVHTFATIGDHAILNTGCIVEHECEIGENVHIAPGAAMGGNVRIGPDTLIGLGSRIIPGISIGRGCTIGAGAVVIRDVPDGATVVGVPALVR